MSLKQTSYPSAYALSGNIFIFMTLKLQNFFRETEPFWDFMVPGKHGYPHSVPECHTLRIKVNTVLKFNLILLKDSSLYFYELRV